jgi:hypothetical protein
MSAPSDTTTTELGDDADLPRPFRSVYAYWREQRAGGAAGPGVDDFHLDELDPKILPWSVLVDVIGEPLDFRFRFWGTERSNLIGEELTGKTTAATPTAYMRDANHREYANVVARRLPALCDTPVTTTTGRETVFQSMRLPLFGPDGRVARIFSAMNYEQINDVSYEYYGTLRTAG